MNITATTAGTTHRLSNGTTRTYHAPAVKEAALLLHRQSWGGGKKIAKFLSKKFGVQVSEFTVNDWIRGVRRDLDPLLPAPGQAARDREAFELALAFDAGRCRRW